MKFLEGEFSLRVELVGTFVAFELFYEQLSRHYISFLLTQVHASERDLRVQARSPASMQASHLRLAHQKSPVGSSTWCILAPFSGVIPSSRADLTESTGETDIGFAKLPGDSKEPSLVNDSAAKASLEERAAWTLDCLEATLNPRGVRESRLRRVINELRPLLIRVIAQCPSRLVRVSQVSLLFFTLHFFIS